MPAFQSNPLNPSPLHRTLRKHPTLFGIPFILIMVGASYGLQSFTQIRYDLHDQKVKQITHEQALGIDRQKKKFDIREEYFNLSSKAEEDWEQKRVPRPPGVPEWGVPPTESTQGK